MIIISKKENHQLEIIPFQFFLRELISLPLMLLPYEELAKTFQKDDPLPLWRQVLGKKSNVSMVQWAKVSLLVEA